VEFAIENAQIVVRRREREEKAKGGGRSGERGENREPRKGGREKGERGGNGKDDRRGGQKRKRDDGDASVEHKPRRNGLSYEENAKRFKKGRGGVKSDEGASAPKPKEDKSATPAKGAFGMQRKRMAKRNKRG